MGLKLRLEWFDKKNELLVGKEDSKDFGDNGSVIEKLDLPLKDNINNGGFDVEGSWVTLLQSHFENKIELEKYWYQISFDYQDNW
ncbi:cloacin immunity family protein [Serratia proteamaculans]|uniref:cloacin immunity family protein n=1 Tax=Serratia proteamaculans TaxID=28151 RepID=UPI00217A6149|nr:cloacin immunity family protein [Serratia proteamaculans]CAI1777433.1 Microcin-E3 immunity protein [Serratia proteamaculans]